MGGISANHNFSEYKGIQNIFLSHLSKLQYHSSLTLVILGCDQLVNDLVSLLCVCVYTYLQIYCAFVFVFVQEAKVDWLKLCFK